MEYRTAEDIRRRLNLVDIRRRLNLPACWEAPTEEEINALAIFDLEVGLALVRKRYESKRPWWYIYAAWAAWLIGGAVVLWFLSAPQSQ